MKENYKSELLAILIVALPFIYLFYNWSHLPSEVAVHWNFQGEVDRYGTKWELLLIPILLPLLTYLIFLLVPFIDPKDKIKEMGRKYHHLKIALIGLMSLLSIVIIGTAIQGTPVNPKLLFFLLGMLYLVLGNYFKTLRPNYFIGIRTPWTLESEEVWKRTHQWSGVLWFSAGIIILFGALILNSEIMVPFFIITTLLIVLAPFIYSYLIFKSINN